MSEDGFDPVEDFFAREREAVVPTEGDDLHWQGIVRDARSRGPARTRGYLTGAAAAAVVVAAVAWGATTGGPGDRSGPTAPVATPRHRAGSRPRPRRRRPRARAAARGPRRALRRAAGGHPRRPGVVPGPVADQRRRRPPLRARQRRLRHAELPHARRVA